MARTAIPLSPYALVTEDEAKTWASIQPDNIPEGDLLVMAINAASKSVEQFLKFDIISRGLITEQYSIRSLRVGDIWTSQRPILAVQEVNHDTGRTFGASTVIPATDYIVNAQRGKITYVGAGGSFPIFFSTGIDVLQIKYWAGVKTVQEVDDVLKRSTLETVAAMYYHVNRKHFDTITVADDQGARTFLKHNWLPEFVKEGLVERRKVILARQSTNLISVDAGTPAP
jgi:hypothetical protein